ncbi:hypothetical protein BXU08_12635 [Sphingomonas sp. LM7]|nr:hypothetical protein BXU08_12635 [Sphingomonas sp. LM7]
MRTGWWTVAICVVLLALWAIRPIGVNPPRTLQTEFNTERAVARLSDILGDQRAHPTDSDANDAVEARLLAQIKQAGFTPEIRQTFHCNDIRQGAAICARPRNIVFWITPPGDDAVMLTAHHDSVPAGPGAADDGIGVAVALEVAHLLKGKPLGRPVLVLLTDAEEAGLVGAAAFAARDPLAKRIGAVVNLEARGTTGTANMFQTSRPNGRDIAALQAGGLVPAANSLASDLYSILPNDTDVTMLLPLNVDVANFAIIGAGKRYHTPLDNLSFLDRNSVRHMGAEALAAVNGFTSAQAKGEEGSRIFVNIDRIMFLVVPANVALALLVLGLGSAVFLYARSGGGNAVKALLAPPLAVLFGAALAVVLGMLVGALRPDSAYGTAWPVALRLMYGAAALTGASLVLHWMRVASPVRLAASAWIWLTILVLAAFAFVPGLSVIAVWSSIFLLAAAITACFAPARRAVPWLLGAAALVFALIMLPIAGGFEDGLFVESAAPIAALLVFLFLFAMPGLSTRRTPLACGAVLAAAIVAALLVPAYTSEAPRHLNLVHEDRAEGASFRVWDNGPLPAAMKAAAAFADAPDAEGEWHAPAPRLADDGRISIVSDTVAGELRTIVLRAEAPSADRQEFYVDKGEGFRSLVVNGARPQVKGPLAYFGCTGRACRLLDVTLTLTAKGPLPDIRWHRIRYGAGEAARALIAARPDTAMPVHVGDRQVLIRPVSLASQIR